VAIELKGLAAADDALRSHIQAEQARTERAQSDSKDQAQAERTNIDQSLANLSLGVERRRHELELSGIYTQTQPNPAIPVTVLPNSVPRQQYHLSEQRYLEIDQQFVKMLRDFNLEQERLRRISFRRNALIVAIITLILIAGAAITLALRASPEVQLTALDPTLQSSQATNTQPAVLISPTETIATLEIQFGPAPTTAPNQVIPTANISTVAPPTVPISTDTLVPSPTARPSETPRPSNTPRPTRTPRPTATDQITCPGLVTPRLVIGDRAQVTPGDANNVRTRPGTNNPRIGSIPGGGELVVLDGPVCADGYVWWRVDFEGLVGWTAEGGTNYFIRPLGRQSSTSITRRQTTAAYQMFDNGYMIWLAYNDQIYVLLEGGQYQVFPDNLDENLRNETIGIQPPPLRFEPRSGFGIVWRAEDSLREAIGWALHLETGYTATATYDASNGAMTITGPERQFFELDGNGRWSGG
jgi:hypothetical protein